MGLDKAGSENLVRVLLAFPSWCELCPLSVVTAPGHLDLPGWGGMTQAAVPAVTTKSGPALALAGGWQDGTCPVNWWAGARGGSQEQSAALSCLLCWELPWRRQVIHSTHGFD